MSQCVRHAAVIKFKVPIEVLVACGGGDGSTKKDTVRSAVRFNRMFKRTTDRSFHSNARGRCLSKPEVIAGVLSPLPMDAHPIRIWDQSSHTVPFFTRWCLLLMAAHDSSTYVACDSQLCSNLDKVGLAQVFQPGIPGNDERKRRKEKKKEKNKNVAAWHTVRVQKRHAGRERAREVQRGVHFPSSLSVCAEISIFSLTASCPVFGCTYSPLHGITLPMWTPLAAAHVLRALPLTGASISQIQT